MVSLHMVVCHELIEDAEQPTLTEEDQAVQTLPPDRTRRPDLAGEEVGSRNLAPVGPEERPPGGRPVRGWRESISISEPQAMQAGGQP